MDDNTRIHRINSSASYPELKPTFLEASTIAAAAQDALTDVFWDKTKEQFPQETGAHSQDKDTKKNPSNVFPVVKTISKRRLRSSTSATESVTTEAHLKKAVKESATAPKLRQSGADEILEYGFNEISEEFQPVSSDTTKRALKVSLTTLLPPAKESHFKKSRSEVELPKSDHPTQLSLDTFSATASKSSPFEYTEAEPLDEFHDFEKESGRDLKSSTSRSKASLKESYFEDKQAIPLGDEKTIKVHLRRKVVPSHAQNENSLTEDERHYIAVINGRLQIKISEYKYSQWKKILVCPKDEWEKSKSKRLVEFRKETEILSTLIGKYQIPFPFSEINEQEAIADFNDAKRETFKGSYNTGRTDFGYKHVVNYANYDPLDPQKNPLLGLWISTKLAGLDASKYCSEEYRLSCNEHPAESKTIKDTPLASWKDPRKRHYVLNGIATHIRTERGANDLTISTKRIVACILMASKVCHDWRPMIYKGIVAALIDKGILPNIERNPIDVLDTSSGFGGRIIGAMTTPGIKSYTGFDPNEKIPYQKLLDTYQKHTKVAVRLVLKPSEDMKASDVGYKTFKLLITSPPYADQERYSNDPTQSWVRHMSDTQTGPQRLKSWLHGYLFRTFYKAWKRLELEGVMAINLADAKPKRSTNFPTKICVPMIDFLKNMGMDYLGCIALSMGKGHEPIWIFKKNGRSTLAEKVLFKSSKITTVSDMEQVWKQHQQLSPEDQDWTSSFFLPKFWNMVRKRVNVKLAFERFHLIGEICGKLAITEEQLEREMKRPEPVRHYKILEASSK